MFKCLLKHYKLYKNMVVVKPRVSSETSIVCTLCCLCVCALTWLSNTPAADGVGFEGVTGGRVARRGRSQTSHRILLPAFTTVQLLHCHSEGYKETDNNKAPALITDNTQNNRSHTWEQSSKTANISERFQLFVIYHLA